MQLNFRPNKVAFIDYETQSTNPLDNLHRYASDHHTRVVSCVVKIDGVNKVLGPYIDAEGKQFLANIAKERVLVAHNASFDAAIHEVTLGLPEATWFDTLPCARAGGYPGKLQDLGEILVGRGKDPRGELLIKTICKLSPGQQIPASHTKEGLVTPVYNALMEYNESDVDLLEEIYHHVKDFGEPDVMTVDRIINDRGVPLRCEMLEKLKHLYVANGAIMQAKFDKITGGMNAGSPKQVKDWMERMGFRVDGLNKIVLKKFLSDPYDSYVGNDTEDEVTEALFAVKEALDARNSIVRVGQGKVDAALRGVSDDGRIREQFTYWGAHTGRWSGRGLQLHNLPKSDVDVRKMELSFIAMQKFVAENSTETKPISISDVLNGFIRRIVEAPNLLVADYGAIEARGIAWVADEGKMLEAFRDPHKSVYLDMGKHVFKREISKKGDPLEYSFSKMLVLGCGYGMSAIKFKMNCDSQLINLDKLGVSAKECVDTYRKTYSAIPQVWKAYGNAVMFAAKGMSTEAGKCKFFKRKNDLVILLPSGRELIYRNVAVEDQVPLYCKLYNMPEKAIPTVTYETHRMYRSSLYGGKVAENVVQAISRDLLAPALVQCEQEGLKPILHVHDEIGCETEDKYLERMLEIMSTPPKWAPDFPILVEGYSGPIWTKTPKGYREVNALNGRMI